MSNIKTVGYTIAFSTQDDADRFETVSFSVGYHQPCCPDVVSVVFRHGAARDEQRMLIEDVSAIVSEYGHDHSAWREFIDDALIEAGALIFDDASGEWIADIELDARNEERDAWAEHVRQEARADVFI